MLLATLPYTCVCVCASRQQSKAVLRRVKWGHTLMSVVEEAKRGTPLNFDAAETLGVSRAELDALEETLATKEAEKAKLEAEQAAADAATAAEIGVDLSLVRPARPFVFVR